MSDLYFNDNLKFLTLKEYFESNDYEKVSNFLFNFVNSKKDLESKNLIIETFINNDNINKKVLIEELTLFLNLLISQIKGELDKNEIEKRVQQFINFYNFKINYIKDLSTLLIEVLNTSSKKNLSNSLISYDWQLSIIESENEKTSTNLNKLDKVEIGIKFKSFDNKTENYKNDVIKMGYNEFYEIFQKMKKIDGQLQLFKN